ncbi:hypothetical protein GH714_006248 [Hevea brasiliensis]|uniref:Uncharacterized protein n=1 Tax=Hevea brasiliensis TaxID=3981 RepID=A0A6A6NFU7_HEVBR|nr:hypothetical protein GH714_006248 [Hevea brasiliensis]
METIEGKIVLVVTPYDWTSLPANQFNHKQNPKPMPHGHEAAIAVRRPFLCSAPHLSSSFSHSVQKGPKPISSSAHLFQWRPRSVAFTRRMVVEACVKVEQKENIPEVAGSQWGKVSAVPFDMDGVLCNSEEPSRMAAVDVFAVMGVGNFVLPSNLINVLGEANLGGVANVNGVKGFSPEAAKKRFFEIYLEKNAKPNSGIGFPGALELVTQTSFIRFDATVLADALENLKPAPDIFLAASKILNVPTSEDFDLNNYSSTIELHEFIVFNFQIKKLDPATKRVITIAGTGKAGFKDGKALAAQLSEPSGIIEAENGDSLSHHMQMQ